MSELHVAVQRVDMQLTVGEHCRTADRLPGLSVYACVCFNDSEEDYHAERALRGRYEV